MLRISSISSWRETQIRECLLRMLLIISGCQTMKTMSSIKVQVQTRMLWLHSQIYLSSKLSQILRRLHMLSFPSNWSIKRRRKITREFITCLIRIKVAAFPNKNLLVEQPSSLDRNFLLIKLNNYIQLLI